MDTALTAPAQTEENVEAPKPKTYGILLQADRCDGCGAQAFVRVVHPSLEAWHGVLNRDLLFCGHHYNKAMLTGKLDEWSVLDERAKIN